MTPGYSKPYRTNNLQTACLSWWDKVNIYIPGDEKMEYQTVNHEDGHIEWISVEPPGYIEVT